MASPSQLLYTGVFAVDVPLLHCPAGAFFSRGLTVGNYSELWRSCDTVPFWRFFLARTRREVWAGLWADPCQFIVDSNLKQIHLFCGLERERLENFGWVGLVFFGKTDVSWLFAASHSDSILTATVS